MAAASGKLADGMLMEFWRNPYTKISKHTCICGKEPSLQFYVRPEIAKRNAMFLVLGIMVLLLAAWIVGLNDLRFWALAGAELALEAPRIYFLISRLRRGHILRCASRYAHYKAPL